MRYDLKKPCNECPYVGKIPGWIGAHDTAQDFVDVVLADAPFPCHCTVRHDSDAPSVTAQMEQKGNKLQHCAGYALFMSQMCKSSRRPELFRMQQRLREECDVKVLSRFEIVEHHTLKRKAA